MAELGAIASIIGLAQFGFSLATQITTYIGDYQDAAEDIQNLAGEIVSTYRHVEQLQGLIDQHATTNAFSPSGLAEADDCKAKARKLAERLWKLVGKSHVEVPPDGSLSADDIDLSIFSKAMWPRFKPRVEQHKRELVVLNQNILIAMVDYRLNAGGSPAAQKSATDERDRLTKSKQRALKMLKDAQEERRRLKAKGRQRKPKVSFDVLPPGRQDSGSERAPPPPFSPPKRPSRGGSYDQEPSGHYGDGDGTYVPDEAFMDRLEEDLRNDIVLQLQKDEADREAHKRETEEAKVMAVTEYKTDLLGKLKQSQEEAENLKKALVKQFPNAISENAVERFVDQRQIEMVRDDELAHLINDAVVQHPVAEPTVTAEMSNDASRASKPRGARLRTFVMLVQEWHETRQRKKRRRERTAVSQIQIFGVMVSVDGDLRQVSPINIPTPWTDHLLAAQEKRSWGSSKSFKQTMQTYARMDWTSRSMAEKEAEKQGLDVDELVLLYARQLDKNTTKGRKLLEATMMASNPWDYYHGRVLLIYKVSTKSKNDRSADSYYSTNGTSVSSPSEHRRKVARSRSRSRRRDRGSYEGYGSEVGKRRSRSGSTSRSRSRSRSPRPYDPDSYEADVEIDQDGLRPYGAEPTTSGSRSRSYQRARSRPSLEEIYVKLSQEDDPRRQSSRDYNRRSRSTVHEGYGMPETGTRRSSSRSRGDRRRGQDPLWIRAHRKHLSPETLRYYDIPWMIDPEDADCIIIQREMDVYETDVLFDHTRQLRQRRGTSPPPDRRSQGPPFGGRASRLSRQSPAINIYNDIIYDAPGQAFRPPSQHPYWPPVYGPPPPYPFGPPTPYQLPPYMYRRERVYDVADTVDEQDLRYDSRSPPPPPQPRHSRDSYAESAGPSTRRPTYDDRRGEDIYREMEAAAKKADEERSRRSLDPEPRSGLHRSRSSGYDRPAPRIEVYDFQSGHERDSSDRERDRLEKKRQERERKLREWMEREGTYPQDFEEERKREMRLLRKHREELAIEEMKKRHSRERADKEYIRHRERSDISRSRSYEPRIIIQERSGHGSYDERPVSYGSYDRARSGGSRYDEATQSERGSSVVQAAEKVRLTRQRARSRLRSRSRQDAGADAEAKPEPTRVAEVEAEEEMDSPSDLFVSEEEDSGDSSDHGHDDPLGPNGGIERHRRSDASTRSSVLGLDTTSASPTTLSDDAEEGVSNGEGKGKGKQPLYSSAAAAALGYRRPTAETIAESTAGSSGSRKATGDEIPSGQAQSASAAAGLPPRRTWTDSPPPHMPGESLTGGISHIGDTDVGYRRGVIPALTPRTSGTDSPSPRMSEGRSRNGTGTGTGTGAEEDEGIYDGGVGNGGSETEDEGRYQTAAESHDEVEETGEAAERSHAEGE